VERSVDLSTVTVESLGLLTVPQLDLLLSYAHLKRLGRKVDKVCA